MARLFDGLRFDVRGILVAQFRLRQLHYGMGGVVIKALAKHLQNLDGGAQFSGGRCHHRLACVAPRSFASARGDVDWFVFMPAIQSIFAGHFVSK